MSLVFLATNVDRCLGNSAGGAEEDRTPDLVIANDALSQLSYSPISGWRIYGAGRRAVKHPRTMNGRFHLAQASRLPQPFAAGSNLPISAQRSWGLAGLSRSSYMSRSQRSLE